MSSHGSEHSNTKPTGPGSRPSSVSPQRTQDHLSVESDILLRPPPIGVSRTSSLDSRFSDPGTPGTPGTPGSLASSTTSIRTPTDPSKPIDVGKGPEKKKKKRSWFSRSKHEKKSDQGPPAWILGDQEKVPYDLENLTPGQKIPELWDDAGDCLIHLSSKESGLPPSMRIQSSAFSSSNILNEDLDEERCLYLPSDFTVAHGKDDTIKHKEALVATTNLFAVLNGKRLIATQNSPSIFDTFLEVSRLLKLFEFTNVDGSTFGEVATSRFDYYVDELGIADVRASPEQIIEGLVLGERMKNVKLYHEAFTHAVGNHQALLKCGSPNYPLVSQVSLNRLSRAAMELERQAAIVSEVLGGLDFPSVFSGIMESRTAPERKYVDFDEWRTSFAAARKFFIGFYKQRYRHWPPKAPSKHSVGLNRLVLQDVYQDLCSLYDLLVDRASVSHRVDGSAPPDAITAPMASALRQTFEEYDRSSPPVKPAIPFDTPKVPSLKITRPDFGKDEKEDAKIITKDLKDDEILGILKGAYNDEPTTTRFTEAFRVFERKRAHSKNIKEIADYRAGYWIFIYALLQVLPMVVIDVPSIHYVKDVEYFLCQPPRFGVPWAKEDTSDLSKLNDPTIARLPADMAEPGVEGVYHRSHCWIMADSWRLSGSGSGGGETSQQPPKDPLTPPSVVVDEQPTSEVTTSSSLRPPPPISFRAMRASSYSAPVGSRNFEQRVRPVSVYDPTKTFDVILKHAAEEKKGQK